MVHKRILPSIFKPISLSKALGSAVIQPKVLALVPKTNVSNKLKRFMQEYSENLSRQLTKLNNQRIILKERKGTYEKRNKIKIQIWGILGEMEALTQIAKQLEVAIPPKFDFREADLGRQLAS